MLVFTEDRMKRLYLKHCTFERLTRRTESQVDNPTLKVIRDIVRKEGLQSKERRSLENSGDAADQIRYEQGWGMANKSGEKGPMILHARKRIKSNANCRENHYLITRAGQRATVVRENYKQKRDTSLYDDSYTQIDAHTNEPRSFAEKVDGLIVQHGDGGFLRIGERVRLGQSCMG